jgi:hypothetical protein
MHKQICPVLALELQIHLCTNFNTNPTGATKATNPKRLSAHGDRTIRLIAAQQTPPIDATATTNCKPETADKRPRQKNDNKTTIKRQSKKQKNNTRQKNDNKTTIKRQ